ncbi:MAG: hypothetical protein ACLFVJ_19470 [Persicimonas sp.]
MASQLVDRAMYIVEPTSDPSPVLLSLSHPERLSDGKFEVSFGVKPHEAPVVERSAWGADGWQALMGARFMMKALLEEKFGKDAVLFYSAEDATDGTGGVSIEQLFTTG